MTGKSDAPSDGGDPGRRSEFGVVEAEARYRRDRLALYRARVLSAKPTSLGRLRELERDASAADARLRQAPGG